MTGISWTNTRCSICMEDLCWSREIAAQPPLEELGDTIPDGHHFMHEQCLERNMLQENRWTCPQCRGCLNTSGYIRITRNPDGSVRLRLIRNEFWRTAPSGADEDTIFQAVFQSSQESSQDETEVLGNVSTAHSFRFWDNVRVTRPNRPGEWELGCVMEVGGTVLRVLLYQSMQHEWFSHTALLMDPAQEN